MMPWPLAFGCLALALGFTASNIQHRLLTIDIRSCRKSKLDSYSKEQGVQVLHQYLIFQAHINKQFANTRYQHRCLQLKAKRVEAVYFTYQVIECINTSIQH
jgi:hypothetical protein